MRDEIRRLETMKKDLDGVIYQLRLGQIEREWEAIKSDIRVYVGARHKLKAIKLVREYWGYGLKAAKALVDSMWWVGDKEATQEDEERTIEGMKAVMRGIFSIDESEV